MIKVSEEYVVEIDTFCYVVKRRLTHRRYSVIRYCDSLVAALKAIVEDMNKRQLREGVHELEEAVEVIKTNNKFLTDLLEKTLEV